MPFSEVPVEKGMVCLRRPLDNAFKTKSSLEMGIMYGLLPHLG